MSKQAMSSVAIICQLIVATTVSAEDLWEHRRTERAFLFADLQARRVGDLLTLVISEATDVDNRDSRGLSKAMESSEAFDVGAATSGGFGSQSAEAELDLSNASDRKFDGSARFSSERQFSDRITMTVMDVLPNGNLVIAGKRRVGVSGDDRELTVSGVVRPYDVSPDNTINSRFVAELRIAYTGRGPETRYTKPGWLSRIGDFVLPF